MISMNRFKLSGPTQITRSFCVVGVHTPVQSTTTQFWTGSKRVVNRFNLQSVWCAICNCHGRTIIDWLVRFETPQQWGCRGSSNRKLPCGRKRNTELRNIGDDDKTQNGHVRRSRVVGPLWNWLHVCFICASWARRGLHTQKTKEGERRGARSGADK